MCGRYSLGVDTDRLIAEFGVDLLTAEHEPRYNIAPTQDVPVVVSAPDGLRLGTLRWGLVPAGSAGPGSKPLINARSETVDRRASFADSFRRRRCWVPADGFYEWRAARGGRRQPFHIRPADGRPFAFAGIWDRWSGDGQELVSCAILTTAPNDAIRSLHDRMPVILTPENRSTWLDPHATREALQALFRPYSGDLIIRPVSTRVNRGDVDDAACIEGIEDQD